MKLKLKFFVGFLFVLTLCSMAPAKTIYVDSTATGINDGSNWTNAHTSLQDALAAGVFDDEIYVAEGIYRPDEGASQTPGDRLASFELKNGVKVYGGFPACGEIWENRDPETYLTILSGDLNQDDIEITDPANLLNGPTRAENSYHVVTATLCGSITILDGFTVKSGNANDTAPNNVGGGMYNYTNSSPALKNCIFAKNSAIGYGGGLHSVEFRSSPTLRNCLFENNAAGNGGGIYNESNSAPLMELCVFDSNYSTGGGGAMHNNFGSPILNNCHFVNNSASDGGGIYNEQNSHPVLKNCGFFYNKAENNSGGAIYNSYSNPYVIYCDFVENTAKNYGGAICNHASNPMIANSRFFGNTASDAGGIWNYYFSHPQISNCLFSVNIANVNNGGAISNLGHSGGYNSNPTIRNCTFYGNLAHISGGGIYNNQPGCTPDIANCIFWENADSGGLIEDEEAQIHGGTIIVNYTCIQGLTGALGGIGNIDQNPQFVNPLGPDYLPGTEDDDLRLLSASPCIDAADNDAVPADSQDIDNDQDTAEALPWDVSGEPRFIDDPSTTDTGNGTAPIVDMGCYEYDNTGKGKCGDRNHPYPVGDLDLNCYVNLLDFALFAAHWLECTDPDPPCNYSP